MLNASLKDLECVPRQSFGIFICDVVRCAGPGRGELGNGGCDLWKDAEEAGNAATRWYCPICRKVPLLFPPFIRLLVGQARDESV